jgi:release factor glutamine methyltransferase
VPYSYRSLIDKLRGAGIENASEEAAMLLCHVCGIGRATCLSDRDRVWDDPTLERLVELRCTRYPLQYILGEWSFYGCDFVVNEHCLIPRPDTELLVENAIESIPKNATVADLCTGSGCIAIALLRARPDVRVVALELFEDTLSLACENARRNGVADRFVPIRADLLSDGVEKLTPHAPFDAILSNPPYIRREELTSLEPELSHEPRAALDGGEDGMVFYRAILSDYWRLLKNGGLVLLEIGHDQAADVTGIAPAGVTVTVTKDLGGNDRVVAMTKP